MESNFQIGNHKTVLDSESYRRNTTNLPFDVGKDMDKLFIRPQPAEILTPQPDSTLVAWHWV